MTDNFTKEQLAKSIKALTMEHIEVAKRGVRYVPWSPRVEVENGITMYISAMTPINNLDLAFPHELMPSSVWQVEVEFTIIRKESKADLLQGVLNSVAALHTVGVHGLRLEWDVDEWPKIEAIFLSSNI